MSNGEDEAARRARLASERMAAQREASAAGGTPVNERPKPRLSGIDPNAPPDIRKAHQSKAGGLGGLVLLIVAAGLVYWTVTRDTSKPAADRKIFEPGEFSANLSLSKVETNGDAVHVYLSTGTELRPGRACRDGWAVLVQEVASEGYTEVVLHDWMGTALCTWDHSMPWPDA